MLIFNMINFIAHKFNCVTKIYMYVIQYAFYELFLQALCPHYNEY